MLLRTEQLTKHYGSCQALDNLDLQVAPGEIFGLLGPNGSGKSTAIRLMLGFLRPTAGAAWIAGHHCWHDSVNARSQVAYLPGELRLYENMTGRELVRFLSRLRSQPDSHEIDRLAATFDIDISRPIAQLSSGMKRKVALLQVLLPRTPLVILDEPTNTLDPTMREELLEQLMEARSRGQTVLFSSHVLSEVEKVCDRVGILKRGRLVQLQEMKQLREIRRIKVAFAGPVPKLPEIPGLEAAPAAEQNPGNTVAFNYGGPLPPLLGWLAQHQVLDLHMEPLGLSAIYQYFHGSQE